MKVTYSPEEIKAYKVNHALQRFKKRYKRELSEDQYFALCELAKHKKVAGLAASGDGNTERVKFRIGTDKILAVYNREFNTIETFLNPYK